MRVWRCEVERHAQEQKQKLEEAEKLAREDIAKFPDGEDGNRLLTKLLSSHQNKEVQRRRKGRRHPYKK